jgi:hypothetical protein
MALLVDPETELGSQIMPQLWTLVLESFRAVSVSKLVESRIVDALIKAFLRASEEIQQSTFPQILAISETIAKDKVNQKDSGKLLSNLVFSTLTTATGNPELEVVGYSVCQGWLDIMISSSVARNPAAESATGDQVHVRMDAAEASSLLRKTTKFLRTHLSLGSFEGPTGAQKAIVMRLNLACDLLQIAFHVKLKTTDEPALSEVERSVLSSKQLNQEYQSSLDDLIAWLFLNARGTAEEQAPSGLGNVALQTPATAKVKRITDLLETYLLKLGSGEKQDQACQIALASLVRVVKQLNRSLSQSAKEATIGADALMTLSRRTNDYFTQFVGAWLKSDSIASHFVFELGGFEFLLDTIGKREEKAEEPSPKVTEARPFSQPAQIDSTIGGHKDEGKAEASSDIYSLLYNPTDDTDQDPKEKVEEENDAPLDEPPQLVLGELATK